VKKTLLLLLLLTSCVTTPKNPEAWIEREQNACLPTAIIFKQALNKYGVWSEVVKYSWIGEEDKKYHGHAFVAYLYPPGKNQLFTYDALGSYRTFAFTNNVTQIAQQAHKVRGSGETIYGAAFVK
jgi:hypothetical protein